MKKEIGLIVDNNDGQENIFERFASAIEQSKLEGGHNYELDEVMEKVHVIEALLQDLSEKIDVKNEKESTVYSVVIQQTRELINKWMILFLNRCKNQNVVIFLNHELDVIIKYIGLENIYNKSISDIEKDFSSIFAIQKIDFGSIGNATSETAAQNWMATQELNKHQIDIIVFQLQSAALANPFLALRLHRDTHKEFMPDGEDVEYLWRVHVWIDTTDAGIANKFMNLVSSTFCYIENVEVNIVSARVGSFIQNWIVKMKGFFAIEDTKEIFAKGIKAAEAYGLDRHIEASEKTKAERLKIEEDTKRLMTEELTCKLHNLMVDEKTEDVKAKKLDNLLKELEIREKLSEMLARGLVETDTDFRIMINDCLLIRQDGMSITTGNMQHIDEGTERRIDSPRDSQPGA